MHLNIRRGGREWLAFAVLMVVSTNANADIAGVVVGPGDGPKVIVRDGVGKPWRLTKDGETLAAGTQVLGGLGTVIRADDGAVTAKLLADFGEHSPFPILETSLVLKDDPKGIDLALQLDRGRVDLENTKKAGAARVQLTIRGKTATITLPQPGDHLVIEMYSRWPRGARFTKTPTEKDVPALAVLLIAAKGEIELKSPEFTTHLKAPPGPAMMLLDDLGDPAPHVESLETLPAWVNEKDTEVLQKIGDSLKQFRAHADKVPLNQGLFLMSMTDNETARRTAVILLGAMDEMDSLAKAMTLAKHQDVVDEGIIVLRHWIGREPGQDLKLYNLLMEKGTFRPAEAEMALQLLHSFSKEDLRQPETYQALIHFLDSDRPLIRALAHWHLVRLVPAGRTIAYKAILSKEDRAKMIKAWEELVPPDTIPGVKK